MELESEKHLGDGFVGRESTADLPRKWDPFLRRAWGHKRALATRAALSNPAGEEVASLTRFSYPCRFGQIGIQVEGIGGFATRPEFRRQGHATRLLRWVLSEAARRVPVLFLHGIDDFYSDFGFAPVAPERALRASAADLRDLPLGGETLEREMTEEDHEKVCALYNLEHSLRPLSAIREAETFSGPMPPGDWHPGERGLVLESRGRLRAFAITRTSTHGRKPVFQVLEAVAASPAAARELLGVLARRCRVETVEILEPADSTLGRALLRMNAEVSENHRARGGWMGKILDREALIRMLGEELDRRAGTSAIEARRALAAGEFFQDDALLLPLLLGHRSWLDARDEGELAPETHRDVVRRWFPEVPCETLPTPYIHHLDRY